MKVYKKFLLAVGCVLFISFFCWISTTRINSTSIDDEILFYQFESQICDILNEDNYDGVEIAENITLNGLIDALDVEPEFMECTIDTHAVDSGVLTYDEVDEICDEFGYDVYQYDEGYVAHSVFGLKRLIVYGNITNTYGATKVIGGFEDMNVLCYTSEEKTEYAYNQLIKDENLSVSIDRIITTQNVDDVIISDNVNTTSSTHKSWGASMIEVDTYIDYLGEISQEVVVAVLDTGINTSHEMFQNRFLYYNGSIVGYSYYNGNSTPIPNSYSYDPDDPNWYEGVLDDFKDYGYSGKTYFEDDNGHGTHVAGIVCDLTPSNVKILPIKVLGTDGSGATLAAVIALWRIKVEYAPKYNIASINMSLGYNEGDGANPEDIYNENENVDRVLSALNDLNILTIASAGNKNSKEASGQPHVYRIAEDTENGIVGKSGAWLASCVNAITVTSLKQSDSSAIFDISYSHYGAENGNQINIAAPGTNIYSAYKGGSKTYAELSGTSMAAPHVAAVVALLCLDNRYWAEGVASYDADEIRSRLYNCAIEMPGKEVYYGNGMLSLVDFNGDIDYTTSESTYTYDGQYHIPTISVSGVSSYTIKYRIEGVTDYYEDISNEVFNNSFKNATLGTMNVWFVITTTDDNKSDTYGNVGLIINQRQIGITLESKQSYYADSISELTCTLSSGSLATGETLSDLNISYYTEASQTADAGEYLITATCNNTNYNATIANATYTIIAKPISVQLGNASGQYGDEFNLSNVEITADLVNDDTIDELNLQLYVTGITNIDNAGTYDSVIDATYTNTNYQITFVKGDYVITPREITINTYQTSVYGDEIVVGDNYEVASGSIVENTDVGIVFTIADLNDRSAVGIYDDVISFSYTNSNYYVQKGLFRYQITARQISVSINNRQCEYGDVVEDNNNLYTITSGNVLSGDSLNIDLTVNLTDVVPKNYSITGKWDNTNYNVIFTNGILTINKRNITISSYQQGEYGTDIAIDNTFYEIESGSLAYIDQDLKLVFTTTATSLSNVGVYPMQMQSCNNYYNVTINVAQYQIVPREIEVVIENKSSQYGASTQILTHKINCDGSSISLNDLPNFSVELLCDVTSQSSVGEYSITGKNNQADKYSITFTNGRYTVTQRPLTIRIESKSSHYGDELQTLTYTIQYGTLAENDTEQGLNIKLSTTATSTSTAEVAYSITGTYNNGNYNVTFVDGNYVIKQREVYIKTEQYAEFGTDIVLDNTNFEVVGGSIIEDDDLNINFTTTANSSSPMGKYVIKMTYNNPNYDAMLSYGYLIIAEKTVTIKIGNYSSMYGEAVMLENVECSVDTQGVSLQDLQLTLSSEASTQKVVGIYDIHATVGNSKYAIKYENPGKYEITKRTLVIDVEQGDIYGNNPELDGDIYSIHTGSIVGQDVLGLSFTTTATSTSPVGGYEVSIKTYTNTNYDISLNSGNYIISARPISILLENCTFNYGESITFDEINYTTTSVNQVVNEDSLDLTISTTSKPNKSGYYNVGNHVITAVSSNLNYNVTCANGKLIIKALTITVDIDSYTNTYGNSSTIQPVYEVSGQFADGEDEKVLNLEFYISNTALNATNVGKYEDSICGRWDNSNYNVVFNNGSYIIIPRDITIKTDQVIEFGQPIILNNEQYDIIDGQLVDGDSLGLIFTVGDATINAPGDYEILLDRYTNLNYNVTLYSGVLTVCNKLIYIIVNDASSVYGDSLSPITYQLKSGYVLENNDTLDDLNIEVSTSATSTSPVTQEGYEITATYTTSNYTVMFETGVYTILPRSIVVKVNNTSSVYGENLSNLTCQLDEGQQLVGTDSLNDLNIQLNCDITPNSIVTSDGYSITSTYSNNNYAVTFTSAKYMIEPRELHITTLQSGIYGENPIINSIYEISEGSSIVDGDTINIVFDTTATNTSGVGDYDIQLVSYDNPNYNIVLDSGKYTVNPKNISIKLINTSSTYGEQLSELEYILDDNSQLVCTDTLEDLNIYPSTTATSTSPVGKYDITATGNNVNYNISFVTGNYMIMAKQLIVVINNSSSYYMQPLSELTHNLNVSNLVGSDTVDDLNIVLSTNATENSDVVDEGYTISGTYNNPNYNITFNNGKYMIMPLRVDIVIASQTSVYGDQVSVDNNLYQISQPTEVTKADLNVILTTSANSTSDVGEYEIYVKSNNCNYNVIANPGIFNITKRSITISLNRQQAKRFFEFKLSNSDYQVIDGDVCEGDDLDLSMITDATWYSWMGEYGLSATSNNKNYDIIVKDSYVDVKVSITDIVAVVLAVALAIFIVIRIIVAIVSKHKRGNQNMQAYIDWINRR